MNISPGDVNEDAMSFTEKVSGSLARAADLWGICAYFNPLGFQRRLNNFRLFRQHLRIPLVAVEYGYQGRFELTDEDADIVVRCSGHDIMWQRERLLNIAMAHVPATCLKIARLDCDIIFDEPEWPALASRMLDHSPLVQLFSEAFDQSRRAVPGAFEFPERTLAWPAFGTLASGSERFAALDRAGQVQRRRSSCAMGLAWGMRRELFDHIGLYDACIVGGGEHALLCAACGVPEFAVIHQKMGQAAAEHYQEWSARFHSWMGGVISSIPGKVFHLWHGDISNRGYGSRHAGFRPFDFSPQADLRLNESAAWCWASDKPEMHAYVREFFESRREDG